MAVTQMTGAGRFTCVHASVWWPKLIHQSKLQVHVIVAAAAIIFSRILLEHDRVQHRCHALQNHRHVVRRHPS